ncbi:MAG: endonuclease/exonuclease/phosphatase family protein [Candidatus Levybacteria bacterium]|nr:endonuclease/exonuclease/phosphatase family protein [Candidatus Levybacteria bacterium]
MKLLSLNVALFESNNDLLSKFLSEQTLDIICLQEVSGRIDSSVDLDYVTKSVIDEATEDLKYSFFGQNLIIKECHLINFHKKANFDFDFKGFIESGNYLKTKFKIIKKSNAYVKKVIETEVTDWVDWPKNQTRTVQVVDLMLPKSKKIRVINYHGIWTKEKIGTDETTRACKKILDLAKQVNYPTIIVGDFNLFPDTPSMRVFSEDFISLVDKHCISTTRPKSNELSHLKRNVVDYILVSRDIKVNYFEVLDSDVSDHLPLILDFDI